ncbi:MAG: hypothetical protein LBR79_07140 [Oscillospiraceae bacterium]|nr:hypothetical protein [Oscillospiraceae bacterium]
MWVKLVDNIFSPAEYGERTKRHCLRLCPKLVDNTFPPRRMRGGGMDSIIVRYNSIY